MSDMLVMTMLSGGAFLSVLLIAVAFAGGPGSARRKRIDAIRSRAGPRTLAPGTAQVRRSDDAGKGAVERKLASFLPRRAALRVRLQRAGISLTLGRYAVICLVIAFSTLAILMWALGFAPVFAIPAAIAAGIMLPHMYVASRIAKRLNNFNKQFPEAIDLMVRGLKSGLPISETLVNVAADLPDPVGTEFKAITDSMRLGTNLDDALWDAAKRIDTAEFRFFVITLSVQRETGGNLAETLSNLGDILRKRLQMRLKVKAVSSEARASAYIIGGLPFVMFGIINLINPDYVSMLYKDPRGLMVMGIGLSLLVLGVIVMFKMVKFEI